MATTTGPQRQLVKEALLQYCRGNAFAAPEVLDVQRTVRRRGRIDAALQTAGEWVRGHGRGEIN